MTDEAKEAAVSQEDAEKSALKASYEETLDNHFTDPVEREVAARQLDDAFDLGLSERYVNGKEMDKGLEDIQKKADADFAKNNPEAVKPKEESPETKVETDPEPAKAETEEKTEAEKEEVPEWQKAIDAQNEKIAKLEARNIELEAKNKLADSDDEIRKEVAQVMAPTLNANKVQNDEFAQQVAKHREDHGEEPAKILEERIEEFKKVRDQNVQRQIDDEFAKRKAERVAQVDEQTTLQQDIAAVPELAQWQRDDNKAKFYLARDIDAKLLSDPEWRGRPQVDRFKEVVKQVKAEYGQLKPGTPKTDEPVKKESDEKKAADEILKEARQKAQENTPNTLSDIPSESSTDSLSSLDGLADMQTIDVHEKLMQGAISIDQLDRMMDKDSAEFYTVS